MSDEDWAKLKADREAEEKEKTKKRLSGLKKERQPKKPPRDGLIGIGDIAKKLSIIPREARSILRGLKEPKPACGWAGDRAWADRIEGLLKGALSKPAKAKKVTSKVGKKAIAKKK